MANADGPVDLVLTVTRWTLIVGLSLAMLWVGYVSLRGGSDEASTDPPAAAGPAAVRVALDAYAAKVTERLHVQFPNASCEVVSLRPTNDLIHPYKAILRFRLDGTRVDSTISWDGTRWWSDDVLRELDEAMDRNPAH